MNPEQHQKQSGNRENPEAIFGFTVEEREAWGRQFEEVLSNIPAPLPEEYAEPIISDDPDEQL